MWTAFIQEDDVPHSIYEIKGAKKCAIEFRSFSKTVAASLLIDTVRTFFLVVLSILAPVAFAFSVLDGFQSTLGQWFTRYISVYVWLPVSDLFSTLLAKLQVLMSVATVLSSTATAAEKTSPTGLSARSRSCIRDGTSIS